jgi:hypothetical protein
MRRLPRLNLATLDANLCGMWTHRYHPADRGNRQAQVRVAQRLLALPAAQRIRVVRMCNIWAEATLMPILAALPLLHTLDINLPHSDADRPAALDALVALPSLTSLCTNHKCMAPHRACTCKHILLSAAAVALRRLLKAAAAAEHTDPSPRKPVTLREAAQKAWGRQSGN